MSASQWLSNGTISVLNEFVVGITTVLPRVLSGLLFLALAYLVIKLIRNLLGRTLYTVYPEDQRLIADVVLLLASVFMWFGVGLTLLSILGFSGIAASLGTATGFIALGVSYALSDMIEDTVAGVYLLRDSDFNHGDTVTTDSTTGTVVDIGLRKSRLRLESGDVMVLGNRTVEKKWTKQSTPVTE
ncbi:MAG: mechanosensitive ion channel domain-containing protein [Halodesulfurarchaeum sp.]